MQVSDLYGLALERFVPERAALAKSLRAQGEREEAARVAKLAKPSVAAWAVNQLVRTRRPEMAKLLEAGDALRKAQSGVMAGRESAAALRQAGDAERSAVAELVEIARGLLDSAGHGLTEATLTRVGETLEAAALSSAAREQVQGGCLVRELRHVGLGDDELAAVPAPVSAPPPRARAATVKAEPPRALERARAREAQARRAAEAAAGQLEAARARRDRAAETLRDADHGVHEAEQALSEAEGALRAAEQAVQQAGG